MTYGIKIIKTENGYYLENISQDIHECLTTKVIEEKGSNRKCELEALQDLFYTLMEFFSLSNSIHYKENLRITIEEKDGDKT